MVDFDAGLNQVKHTLGNAVGYIKNTAVALPGKVFNSKAANKCKGAVTSGVNAMRNIDFDQIGKGLQKIKNPLKNFRSSSASKANGIGKELDKKASITSKYVIDTIPINTTNADLLKKVEKGKAKVFYTTRKQGNEHIAELQLFVNKDGKQVTKQIIYKEKDRPEVGDLEELLKRQELTLNHVTNRKL